MSDPRSEQTTWRICPVCRQPNRSEIFHCHHCWGASLYQVKPIDSDELLIVRAGIERRTRRNRLIKIISVSILAPTLLIASGVLSLYAFTDLILAPSPDLDSVSAPGEWAMFRGDSTRSGAADPIGLPPKGELKWKFETGAPVRTSPALANGTIYFGSQDFSLYALDAETGEKEWEFQTGSWVESSPAVAAGVVYFGSNDGYFYALDADTGEEHWRHYIGLPVQSSPAIAGGNVFFGSGDYTIYCLSIVTGDKVWEFETNNRVTSSPVIDNGVIYVGSMDGSLYGLQASNGRFRLRMRYPGDVASSPAVYDGVVYYTNRSRLFAIDSMARNWPGEHDLRNWWIQFYAFRLAPQPPPISGLLWTMELGRAVNTTTPAIIDGIVYTTSGNTVYAVDTEKADLIWSFPLNGTIHSSAALGNGILYVGSGDGQLFALDAENGDVEWSFTTGAAIRSSPVVSNGVIYVGSSDGAVYAIK